MDLPSYFTSRFHYSWELPLPRKNPAKSQKNCDGRPSYDHHNSTSSLVSSSLNENKICSRSRTLLPQNTYTITPADTDKNQAQKLAFSSI